MAEDSRIGLNRIERILAVMIAAVGGLSILAMVAVLFASAAGQATGEGAWLFVTVLPTIGLPIAFLIVLAFLIVAAVRRRNAPDGSR